jgi:hypothetical protein
MPARHLNLKAALLAPEQAVVSTIYGSRSVRPRGFLLWRGAMRGFGRA